MIDLSMVQAMYDRMTEILAFQQRNQESLVNAAAALTRLSLEDKKGLTVINQGAFYALSQTGWTIANPNPIQNLFPGTATIRSMDLQNAKFLRLFSTYEATIAGLPGFMVLLGAFSSSQNQVAAQIPPNEFSLLGLQRNALINATATQYNYYAEIPCAGADRFHLGGNVAGTDLWTLSVPRTSITFQLLG